MRLRHLLVPFAGDGADARKAACATAERARARLVKGEAFDVVASQIDRARARHAATSAGSTRTASPAG